MNESWQSLSIKTYKNVGITCSSRDLLATSGEGAQQIGESVACIFVVAFWIL